MNLTSMFTALLAKAQVGLFDDFETRKTHLRLAVQVDKRGRVTHRWVGNEQPAKKERQVKPAQPERQTLQAMLLDQMQAAQPKATRRDLEVQRGQGGLFGSDDAPAVAAHKPAPVATVNLPKAKVPKAAPHHDLFDFDFTGQKPTLTMPSAPVAEPTAIELHGGTHRVIPTGEGNGNLRPTATDSVTYRPNPDGTYTSYTVNGKGNDFKNQDGLLIPIRKAQTPKVATVPQDAPQPLKAGTLAPTPAERAHTENGLLHVGDHKIVNGVSYTLNKTHRWERDDDAWQAEVTDALKRKLNIPMEPPYAARREKQARDDSYTNADSPFNRSVQFNETHQPQPITYAGRKALQIPGSDMLAVNIKGKQWLTLDGTAPDDQDHMTNLKESEVNNFLLASYKRELDWDSGQPVPARGTLKTPLPLTEDEAAEWLEDAVAAAQGNPTPKLSENALSWLRGIVNDPKGGHTSLDTPKATLAELTEYGLVRLTPVAGNRNRPISHALIEATDAGRKLVNDAPAAQPAMTPQTASAQLQSAVQAAQADPTPEAEQTLRAAVKTVQVVSGQSGPNASHTVPAKGDTPAPAGQAYLVGLPERVKDKQRRTWNNAAEALISELRANPRETTVEERQLLARYSGNGGIGASLNEFYTPPELGEAMWKILAAQGSGTGEGLEPSSGPGVLVQFALEDARMDAVELEVLSAGIANTLFGHRHDVHSMSFEAFHARNPDKRYDFSAGNPPFGPRDENRMLDEDYQGLPELARYFTLRTLDHLKGGGTAALVLPAGIARNKTDAAFRARILARAEIVAIHGLPTDTFSRAGTESATTDLWILKARPEGVIRN